LTTRNEAYFKGERNGRDRQARKEFFGEEKKFTDPTEVDGRIGGGKQHHLPVNPTDDSSSWTQRADHTEEILVIGESAA